MKLCRSFWAAAQTQDFTSFPLRGKKKDGIQFKRNCVEYTVDYFRNFLVLNESILIRGCRERASVDQFASSHDGQKNPKLMFLHKVRADAAIW